MTKAHTQAKIMVGAPHRREIEPDWMPNLFIHALLKQFLLGRGIPAEWEPYCQVIDWFRDENNLPFILTDSRVEFSVGGDAPPRSLHELEHAIDLGLDLAISPNDGLDLSLFRALLPRMQRLSLGPNRTVTGWSALADSGLVNLWATPSQPLPVIESLEHLVGFGAHALSAMASPRLTSVIIELSGKRWNYTGGIAGPVTHLELAGLRSHAVLPALAHPEALKTLKVHRAGAIDLTALGSAENLEWIDLAQVRELRGFSVVRDLPNLSLVTVTGAWAISEWDVLLEELPIDRVVIERQRAIPEDAAKAIMERSNGRWHVDLPK